MDTKNKHDSIRSLDLALSALPDSETAGPDGTGYKYAWDELVPAEQEWLKVVRSRIRTAQDTEQWVIDNIYTIARREANRSGGDIKAWGHVLRLCEKVGCQPHGVLRDNGGSLSQIANGQAEP